MTYICTNNLKLELKRIILKDLVDRTSSETLEMWIWDLKAYGENKFR